LPEPPLTTRLTEAYRVAHPVACAGMAFAGMTPALPIAVCRAGGIGSFGVGRLPPPAVREAIRAIAAGVAGAPFTVNFITIFTEREHIEVCAEERVPVVSFHWGAPPAEWVARLHDAGVRVWEQVGSVEAAERAAEAGMHAVVAQGVEAGGHNYAELPTFALVPAVVDAVAPVLVLASGGIADGRGLAAALALGADGAWVGTRLVATSEANAHPEYQRRLLAARGTDTVLTPIFGPELPSFNPMRVLRTRVVAEHEGREGDVPPDTADQPVVGRTVLGGHELELRRFTNLVPTPETSGDFEELPLLAGQSVGLVRDVRPAGEVVREMVDEAAAVIGRLAGR
jgi:enoyl-[acyl-carrier protein] reductase II